MRKRKKTPDEDLADLVRGYGSFAEAGRRFANFYGVKPETAARYIAQAARRERDIPAQLVHKIKEKIYYEQVAKPRRQIRRADDIREKLEIADQSPRREIELTELLPPDLISFGFDFQDDVETSESFKFVREALQRGMRIKVVAQAEGEDGVSDAVGYISGLEEVIDPRRKTKKTTKKYISDMYHIMRRAYNKTGAISWITTGSRRQGGIEIG